MPIDLSFVTNLFGQVVSVANEVLGKVFPGNVWFAVVLVSVGVGTGIQAKWKVGLLFWVLASCGVYLVLRFLGIG